MILSIGNYGWANIKFENNKEFVGNASYLTDVPMDFLDSFITFFKNGNIPAIKFDEEGSSFIVVADFCDIYILVERDTLQTYHIDMFRTDFISQIVSDIEQQLDNAVSFTCDCETVEEYKIRKDILIEKINEVRKSLNAEQV